MTAILLELNRAASIAITGILALAIAYTALAVWAEPALKRQALAQQESHATWVK